MRKYLVNVWLSDPDRPFARVVATMRNNAKLSCRFVRKGHYWRIVASADDGWAALCVAIASVAQYERAQVDGGGAK